MTRIDPRSLRRGSTLVAAMALATWAASTRIDRPAALAAVRQGDLPVAGYELVKRYPHDINAFTQGLEFADGVLYEGTGKYGQSRLRRVELATGKVLQESPLPDQAFGEGITLWGDKIIQLTWQNQVGLVFDRQSLRWVDQFRYAGEGWGLTHDATHLIMSDGSSTLRFLDPKTFRVVRSLNVTANGRRLDQLNELEYIKGEIWANIWYKHYIARISPETGRVVGWVDLAGLEPRRSLGGDQAVLNGIAYDAAADRLFVTGKNWSELFEIKLKEPEVAEPEPAEPEPAEAVEPEP